MNSKDLLDNLGRRGAAYKQWYKTRKKEQAEQLPDVQAINDEIEADHDQIRKANLDQLEELATEGIWEYLNSKNPYNAKRVVEDDYKGMEKGKLMIVSGLNFFQKLMMKAGRHLDKLKRKSYKIPYWA